MKTATKNGSKVSKKQVTGKKASAKDEEVIETKGKKNGAEKKSAKKNGGEAEVTVKKPKALAKAMADYDGIEVKIADLREEQQKLLPAIREAAGAPSFAHPETGAMVTVQSRNGAWFMRAKPDGMPAKPKKTAKPSKVTKKTPTGKKKG